MRPILFSVGSLNFYSYGFFAALAFLAAGVLIDYLAGKKRLLQKKQPEYFLIDMLLVSLIAGLISARLGYILLYNLILKTEIFNPSVNLLGGGFIFYLGLAVGLAVMAWWLKRQNEPVAEWLDLTIIAIIAGYAGSEIGGWLNDNQVTHLAGLFGSLAVAIVSYIIWLKEKRPGQTFRTSLFLFFVVSFFVGFWGPTDLLWFGLTLGQWASFLGIVVLGLIHFRLNKVLNKVR